MAKSVKILAILQARVGSQRLPKKVLLKVCGKALLEHQIERIKRSTRINRLVLATTTAEEDRALVKIAKRCRIDYFTGSDSDVLDRYYKCAFRYNPEIIVRLTADMPAHDAEVIDEAIEKFQGLEVDYLTNAINSTYPDGVDTEVMTFNALKATHDKARLPSEREHVTLYIQKNANRNGKRIFKMHVLKNAYDFSHIRLSVDERNDYMLIKRVFEYLYPRDRNFRWMNIISLLTKRPELLRINSKIIRNEGLKKSLIKDKKVKGSEIRKIG